MTDIAAYYRGPSIGFAGHETVNHLQDEYVRGEVHANTVDGNFSLLKRGVFAVSMKIALKSICSSIWRNSILSIIIECS